MQLKLIPFVAIVVLLGLAAQGMRSSDTLSVPADGELGSIYGGACLIKTSITCNGADPKCVETDCYSLRGEGTRSYNQAINCGVFTCGWVAVPTVCHSPGG